MVRDDEIKRLVHYAKGLGLTVRFRSYIPRSLEAACHEVDSETGEAILTIFPQPKESKLSIVLSLIHEIGHQLDFIASGRAYDTLTDENEATTLEQFKEIYKTELAGTKFWDRIYDDTDCKFPKWRLEYQKELDVWHYLFRVKKLRFPTRKETSRKAGRIKLRYKPN